MARFCPPKPDRRIEAMPVKIEILLDLPEIRILNTEEITFAENATAFNPSFFNLLRRSPARSPHWQSL
jgi:hypothetical protein